MEKQLAKKLLSYGREIYLSIVRSTTRKKVLNYLKNNGIATPFEISRRTGLDYANVRGAIFGNGKRFARETSLQFLGLVKSEPGPKGSTLYSLTPEGMKIAGMIEQMSIY